MARNSNKMRRYHYRKREEVSARSSWITRKHVIYFVAGVLGLLIISGIAHVMFPHRATPADVTQINNLTPRPAQRAIASVSGSFSVPIVTRSAVVQKFSKCGGVRVTCVVDGDTLWLDGEKIRVADIDTPEISQPGCAAEKELGLQATQRLIELLNLAPFELRQNGGNDEDQYGRKLRIIMRDGVSLGDQLVSEGLARSWTGQRQPWC